MAEGNKPFVVTDRRKFTMEGEVRPDAEREPKPEREEGPGTAGSAAVAAATAAPAPVANGPQVVRSEPPTELLPVMGAEHHAVSDLDIDSRQDLPPAPTAEQIERSRTVYQQTTDRLDVTLRANNPGGEHSRPMDFLQMVQSFYMTAILQLGGTLQEGQQPQVDLLGARQSIDMLSVLESKTKGNLAPDEERLLESALFDARVAFLELTQAIARQAQTQAKGGPGGFGGPGGGMGGPGGGMGIVR